MSLNHAALGRTWTSEPLTLSADLALAYARATDDPNAEVAEGLVCPPLLCVRPFHGVAMQLILDPGVGCDFTRLVHGEQDIVFHRALHPGEAVVATAEVAAIESKSSGELLVNRQVLRVGDDTVVEATSGYFIRAPRADAPKGKRGPRKPIGLPEGEPSVVLHRTISRDLPARYAAASADDNPIHLDSSFAKKVGLPGVILHGLCSMAVLGQAVVQQACGGQVERLARLKVRFAGMVVPGDTLTVRGWPGEGRVDLIVQNQAGRPVITHALAELR